MAFVIALVCSFDVVVFNPDRYHFGFGPVLGVRVPVQCYQILTYKIQVVMGKSIFIHQYCDDTVLAWTQHENHKSLRLYIGQ